MNKRQWKKYQKKQWANISDFDRACKAIADGIEVIGRVVGELFEVMLDILEDAYKAVEEIDIKELTDYIRIAEVNETE